PSAEARMEARHESRPSKRRSWEKRAKLLENLEARACRESDHILAVSGPLRDRVCSLGNRAADSVTVVPCCISSHRFREAERHREEMRRRLGLEDRQVLVYSGSMSVWQLPGRLASLAEEVCKQETRACLLLLTPNREEAERHFGRLLRTGS